MEIVLRSALPPHRKIDQSSGHVPKMGQRRQDIEARITPCTNHAPCCFLPLFLSLSHHSLCRPCSMKPRVASQGPTATSTTRHATWIPRRVRLKPACPCGRLRLPRAPEELIGRWRCGCLTGLCTFLPAQPMGTRAAAKVHLRLHNCSMDF